MTASDIPDWETAYAVVDGLHKWWIGLDDRTVGIIKFSQADLSDGLAKDLHHVWQMVIRIWAVSGTGRVFRTSPSPLTRKTG